MIRIEHQFLFIKGMRKAKLPPKKRMGRSSIVSHHGLASMLPPEVKFNRGDGIESKGGLVSRGSRGPKPPA